MNASPPAEVERIQPSPPHPSTPPSRRRKRELGLRLLTAAILVPPVLYVIVYGGLLYLFTVILITVLGLREFYQLIEAKGAHPLVGFGLAAGAALPVVAYFGNEYHATILMTVVLLVVLVAQLGKAQISEALASVSGTFFGIFYVGWLLSHVVTLRFFHHVAVTKWGAAAGLEVPVGSGIFYVIFALATVVLCDAGAYFSGRAWGRRKLAPAISPGKTLEGALGGVVAGTVAGLVTKGIFDIFWPTLSHDFPWALAAALGPVLSIAGIVGDLVESLLKRDAERKDTGSLLPGTGGVLDRIDSSLLGIPVMYYLLLAHTFLRLG